MFEEPHDIATQCTTNYEAIMLRPAQRSREAALSSDMETLFDIAAHDTQEGVKGGKKRHKQHLEGTTTTTDGNDGGVGGSGVRRTPTAAHIDKRQSSLPTDHIKKLFEEACVNHAYLIRHKLKDYSMMRSFMTSGSIT
jgi:hypothetical protein